MKHERTISISYDHPALPGHFPGQPVVPGVVILEEVIDCLRAMCRQGLIVTGLPMAKLLSPLSPGERLTITLEAESGSASFVCSAGGRPVATGTIQFRLRDPVQSGTP